MQIPDALVGHCFIEPGFDVRCEARIGGRDRQPWIRRCRYLPRRNRYHGSRSAQYDLPTIHFPPSPSMAQFTAALLPRIISEALSAIIMVEALRLAEIMRGMI